VEAADCVFLGIISFLSSTWYVARLGFYSDDWGLFAAFQLSPDRSLSGLIRASFVDRPAQGVYSILLYRAFGLHPLGYHVINATVIACASVLLYLVLRRLQPSRAFALGIALVYVVLPNYSTDRFWFAAFAAPLSVVFYLLSLWADLDAVEHRGVAFVVRRCAAIGALLISVLAYETTLPFFFLNPLVVWVCGKKVPPLKKVLNLLITWAVLVLVAAYKASTSPRLHAPRGLLALMWSITTNLFRPGFKDGDYGLNLRAAFNANFGDYVFRLPATIWSLHLNHPVAWLPLAAVILGVAVFLYARLLPADFTVRQSAAVVAIGVVVFLVGYSMFLTNKAIQITPTGVGNRTSIAAALGVAFVVAGLSGLIAGAFTDTRARTLAFAALLGGYAAGGFFVLSTLSSYWIDAYGTELAVATDVETHVPELAPRTTLLLGGICSYSGPAIIFESDWDLSGALRLHFGDRTISADILRPHFYEVTGAGITTILYEGADDYEFSPALLLYDYRRKTVTPLVDGDTARAALHGGRMDAACPQGGEGTGVRVF
jgi:hypothetical protein